MPPAARPATRPVPELDAVITDAIDVAVRNTRTNHTVGGRESIYCTHKYAFEQSPDWSLCSDNAYEPRRRHFQLDFRSRELVDSTVGQLLTRYNHANSTTLLDLLHRMGKLRIYAERSLFGPGQWYTDGAPAEGRDMSMQEMPVTAQLDNVPTQTMNGVIIRQMPCGGSLLNEGSLEQIVNHAIHIVYTEGARSVTGPGFKVQYCETGDTFATSDTRIAVSFYFNDYPVWVKFARRQYAGAQSPCALYIRALPQLVQFFQPPIIGRETIRAIGDEMWQMMDLSWEGQLTDEEMEVFTSSINSKFAEDPATNHLVAYAMALSEFFPEVDSSFCVDLLHEFAAHGVVSKWAIAEEILSDETQRSLAIQGFASALVTSVLVHTGFMNEALRISGVDQVDSAEVRDLLAPHTFAEPAEPAQPAEPALSRRQRRRQERVQQQARQQAERTPSPEELAQREAAAEAERARRQEIHDAHEAALGAEENARELRRKLHAIESRKAAAAAGPKPYTPRAEPPKSKKSAKKQARAEKRFATKQEATLNELEHEVHIQPERHAVSEAAFKARQDLEHAEKVARDARARVDRLRSLAAAASAEHEAATHVVPPRPTFGATLEAAIAAVHV
jgi:hypothetical protein